MNGNHGFTRRGQQPLSTFIPTWPVHRAHEDVGGGEVGQAKWKLPVRPSSGRGLMTTRQGRSAVASQVEMNHHHRLDAGPSKAFGHARHRATEEGQQRFGRPSRRLAPPAKTTAWTMVRWWASGTWTCFKGVAEGDVVCLPSS